MHGPEPAAPQATAVPATGTVVRWLQRLSAERVQPNMAELPQLERRYTWLRIECRQTSRGLQELLQTAQLEEPELAPLLQVATDALSLCGIAEEEFLQVAADPHAPRATPAFLEDLVGVCRDRLERIQRQLLLLDRVCGLAEELHRTLEELIRGEHRFGCGVHFQRIADLAARAFQARQQDQLALLPPLSLRLPIDRLARRYGSTAGRTYVLGIATAQAVGRVARTIWLNPAQLEQILAAGLLHDVGYLLVKPEQLSLAVPDTDHRKMLLKHPSIGAALVNMLRGCPPALGRIIAQHHERLDGSGYPYRRRAAELGDYARLVAAAAQFQEFRLEQASPTDMFAESESADIESLRSLLQEAESGRLDASFVAKLLSDRDPELLARLMTELPPSNVLNSSLRLALHDREPEFPPPQHVDHAAVRSPLQNRANQE